ncbi:MAG TPA: hypothetical protein VFZ75_13050 [Actinomycetota bacterium]|nr:hypothetical protein [Actinomycetota bacterium]
MSSGVPARPDAPPALAARIRRRWLPTLLVAATIAVTVLGGFVVAGALPPPDVRPLSLADVVTLRPLPGWEVVRREEASIQTPDGRVVPGEFAQLTRGSGALDLLALPDVGADPVAVAELYADEVLTDQLERLSISEVRPAMLANGSRGVRFGYIGSEPSSGAAVEGVVTVVVTPEGDGVVFDGWAFQGQLELLAEELAAMIDRAEVG